LRAYGWLLRIKKQLGQDGYESWLDPKLKITFSGISFKKGRAAIHKLKEFITIGIADGGTKVAHLSNCHLLSYQKLFNASDLTLGALFQGAFRMIHAFWQNFVRRFLVIGICDYFKIEFSISSKEHLAPKYQHIGLAKFPQAVVRQFSFMIRDRVQNHDSFSVLVLRQNNPRISGLRQELSIQLGARDKSDDAFDVFFKGSLVHEGDKISFLTYDLFVGYLSKSIEKARDYESCYRTAAVMSSATQLPLP
jgi:hypothetical protein